MEAFSEKMSRFPCTFNLQPKILRVNNNKLKYMKNKMEDELMGAEGYTRMDDVQKLNCLTWVYFQLERGEKAREINTAVLERAGWENLTAIGNKAFLSFVSGDERDAHKCISKLETLAESKAFDVLYAEAKANQAYVHSRLSGFKNMKLAIEEYEYALSQIPGSFSFKFGLGLIFRRFCNINLNSGDASLPFDECHRNAIRLFSYVAEKCPDESLKAIAFSELAGLRSMAVLHLHVSEIDTLFKGKIIEQLCDEALITGSEDIYVLNVCGLLWKRIKIDKGIMYLEKSISIRKTSNACHELGKAYEHKAKMQTRKGSNRDQALQRNDPRVSCNMLACSSKPSAHQPLTKRRNKATTGAGRESCGQSQSCQSNSIDIYSPKTNCFTFLDLQRSWKLNFERPLNGIPFFSSSPMKIKTQLGTLNSNTERALQNYKDAIDLSYGTNTPALYSLGLLLRNIGKTEEALQQFNKITNSESAYEHNLPTVVNALEQAGYCYTELADATQDKSLEDEAERKLTKAVGVASSLAAKVPEFKKFAHIIWHAFRSLEQKLENETQCPESVKKLFHLLYNVRNYDKAAKLIYKLLEYNDDELDDETIVEAALGSFIQENRFEDALSFLEMVLTRPSYLASGEWHKRPMVLRVMLKTAEARMKAQEGGVTDLFRRVFKCVYVESSGNGSESPDVDQIGDVLLIHDEWHNTEEGPSLTTRLARGLRFLISDICGLNVSVNSERHCSGWVEMDLQLQEARSHRVCILLVGGDLEESEEYKHLLSVLRSIPESTCMAGTSARLVVKLEGQSRVGDIVVCYRRFQLIGEQRLLRHLGEIKQADEVKVELDEEDSVFVMKFFRFLVGEEE